MAEYDGALRQALGAGRAHIVLAECLKHAGSGDAGDRGNEAGGKGDGWQDQVLPRADARCWQQPELDGKDDDEDDGEKKLRRDNTEDRAHGGGGVDDAAAAQRGDDAERQAEDDAKHESGAPEAQTVGQPFEDDGRGGHAVAEGVAEVKLQRALPEYDVLDDGVLVQPHLAPDLLVLLLDLRGSAVRVQVDAQAGGIAGHADQEEDQRYNHEYD